MCGTTSVCFRERGLLQRPPAEGSRESPGTVDLETPWQRKFDLSQESRNSAAELSPGGQVVRAENEKVVWSDALGRLMKVFEFILQNG